MGLAAEWLAILREPGQKINRALNGESWQPARGRPGLPAAPVAGMVRGQGSLLRSRAASLPAASHPSQDALATLHLGCGPLTPLEPAAEQPCRGHAAGAIGALLFLKCGLAPRDGAGAGAWTCAGDYGQAETVAIRESGLHLALLRAWLSNSCFNQWNCKILQLP